jgi:hypothetical protein
MTRNLSMLHYISIPLAIASTAIMTLSACGGGGSAATTTATASTGTNYSTSGVLCSYSTSVPYTSATLNTSATAAWSCRSTLRSLTANGLPDHVIGTFPNADNPNTITAQNVSASATLAPTKTSVTTSRTGPMALPGYVLNGVPLDPGTAGTCDNGGTNCSLGPPSTGAWNIEALGQSFFRFGTDSSNAHVQPQGTYHYHGIPEGFVTKLSNGSHVMTLIGWAADGFPIYARYGYTVATDATSAIKVVTGSYRVKTAPDANRPATSLYAMGTFTQDYEYIAGSGDLDECNGRTGVTPEFPNGIYHYFATDTYPYLQRCVKGSL